LQQQFCNQFTSLDVIYVLCYVLQLTAATVVTPPAATTAALALTTTMMAALMRQH
jgi:hypothetical protein